MTSRVAPRSFAQMQRHTIGRLLEAEQFGAQLDLDAIIGRGMFAQGSFDRRLREHHAGRVAERIGLRDHVDPADQLPFGAEMLEAGNGAT